MLEKAMAKRRAREEGDKLDGGKKVYFLSLIAADRFGKPINKTYVYDLVSDRYDLPHTGDGMSPIFMDVPRLIKYYKENRSFRERAQGAFRPPSVYDLAKFFIAKNPDSHYFLDECPIMAEEPNLIYKALSKVGGKIIRCH